MSRRRSRSVDARAMQPALSLGHAEVSWQALPSSVQRDVLARWCELLRDVLPPAMDRVQVDAEPRP